ncbi:MAG: ornithine carbamoyltransferase [Dehalococcoidia bacterium]|nr:ornithine carbamoyltransferase [Dehalococcoidia bacterium]MDD5495331.1 ornithine carbamoyltransferase [Dehalococcoidia bacterium]
MAKRDILSVADFTPDEVEKLVQQTVKTKKDKWPQVLAGKNIALLFEKPSLRTKMSFDLAVRQLGGYAIYMSPDEVGLGTREAVPDVAHVLSRYVQGIVARTFAHKSLETLAAYSTVPVINALSDHEHPCQALADLVTIFEKKGKFKGLTLAYMGDGNNVANSLLLACSMVGINFLIASPEDYSLKDNVLKVANKYAEQSGSQIMLLEEPAMAAKDADIIYTDVWTSMGQEAEHEQRCIAFAKYQVDDKLISYAKKDAILMHPLPAHHGEEVEVGIIDRFRSVIFDQAENRLHFQRTLLAELYK